MLRTATCRQAGFLRLRTRLQESARLHRGRGEPFAPQCGSRRGHLLAQKRMRRGSSESTPVRASWRQSSRRRGTVSWSWGDQCRPALHQRQTGAAMVVTCCLIPCHPPHPRKPLRVAQSLSPCNAVLLLPFQDYDVSPAAARRAFRRVPSRRELSLQAVVLTLRSAAVRLFYFHTRARPATSSSPISSMW